MDKGCTRARGERGMHTAEYAICFGLVVAAVVGMQTSVRRAIQARIKASTDVVAGVAKTSMTIGGQTVSMNPNDLNQYEPYYEHSAQDSDRASLIQETHDGTDPTKSGAAPVRKEQSRTFRKFGADQGESGASSLDSDKAWINNAGK